MSLGGFDELIHAPLRLRVCAILSATDEAEFALVRDETGVSESVLSKHVKQLEEAIETLRNQADVLRGEVRRFRV